MILSLGRFSDEGRETIGYKRAIRGPSSELGDRGRFTLGCWRFARGPLSATDATTQERMSQVPAYEMLVDVSAYKDKRALRRIAERLEQDIEKHRPFKRRTGFLSEQAYYRFNDSETRLIVGHGANYTSYLTKGTRKITAHNWIERHINRRLRDGRILGERLLVGLPNPYKGKRRNRK